MNVLITGRLNNAMCVTGMVRVLAGRSTGLSGNTWQVMFSGNVLIIES